ncbi:MAG: PD40 domain-containing protein [Bacteroidales bacterium]|nr:PD40 domain-containing protein [Bacteroidales bacterium]
MGSKFIYSQDWSKIFIYERDAEYQMADNQYNKAAETFKKALRLIPESASFKFKIGYCFLNSDDRKSEAISYLEEASQKISKSYDANSFKEMNAPTETLYLLAEALRIERRYDEAIEAYKKYKEYLKPGDKLIDIVDQNIACCSNANNFIKDSLSVKAVNLGKLINNELPNTNAVISGDGNTLAYTNVTKSGNDVFVSNKVNGNWSAPKKITTQLGDKYFLTCFLSYDGKDLYLSLDDPKNCDLYVTTFEKNKWISALKFEKPINSKSNETHACLTKDGNTIYFTSDRKGGLGGFDIYKSVVNAKGVWGDPVNLGPEINTKFNEATPFLSPDEKYLFFSSEGHDGMGGYDIFFVNLEGTPKVVNLGYPVNNSDNNLFYFPIKGWKEGLLSFYKKDGFGKRDIYHLDISRYTNLNGKILADANSSPYRVSILDVDKNDTIARPEPSNNNFSYKVGVGNYKVFVKNSKYLPFTQDISIPEDNINKDFNFDAKLQPIPVVAPKLVAEVLPKEPKKDSVIIEKPKTVLADNTKKETKPTIEKPREVKKDKPIIKIENTNTSNSSVKISTYAVQIMALKVDVGADYFKNIENIEITQSPEGFYRYSVGSTESMEEAMATLKKVKELGYEKAFVRIDKKDAMFTIQLMSHKTSVDLSTFKNISGITESKGNDGIFRYYVGSFSSSKDAKGYLNSIIELGYKDAFIKKVEVK